MFARLLNLLQEIMGGHMKDNPPFSQLNPDDLISRDPSDSSASSVESSAYFRNSSKPYIRWWWLQGPFQKEDIVTQLAWLKAHGFGGVELAWLYPGWLGRTLTAPPEWLSAEWSELVAFTKSQANEMGLGCDFTFGSCWPFGGSLVSPEDSAQTFFGPSYQRLRASWEDYLGLECRVVNHLRGSALRHYAKAMQSAFAAPLSGEPSALFCDSLEIKTHNLWSPELWDSFAQHFAYRLEPFAERLNEDLDVRYDYRAFISQTIVREFYQTFTDICHELGAVSRVQCHGAPADLLSAYGVVDIPESETLLFEPHFSRIPASAAAWHNKPVVSAETFTCIYGFSPYNDISLYKYWKKAKIADLKSLADAIFAHGVNQIVWHGMPYNPYNAANGQNEFYAFIHVGPDAELAPSLPAFNAYLEKVSALLKLGQTYTNLAIYLPNEDNWMLDRIPQAERTPGANHRWEMRHVVVPTETEGYHPLWISAPLLQKAEWREGKASIGERGEHSFNGLYVDCQWLSTHALAEILRLAQDGMPLILKRTPQQPGHIKQPNYEPMLTNLLALPNVFSTLEESPLLPLLQAPHLPWYWARQTDKRLIIFFAHPDTRQIRYPMSYGQAQQQKSYTYDLQLRIGEDVKPLRLVFPPAQSLCISVDSEGTVEQIDIEYLPEK